jgi:XTP/dITP diphosphohydrolase
MDLVIATTNSSKIRELRSVLEDLLPEISIRSLIDFPGFHADEVGGDISFEENAAAKAFFAAKALNTPCIADESGLVIPFLGDCQESFRRKRLQPVGKKLPNTQQILSDLKDAEEVNRTAFLECVIAFATPEALIKTTSARVEGMIATSEHGPASFDFSSIFIKHEYGKTLAELPESAYERISHRKKACEKLWPFLREYFCKFTRCTNIR